MSTQQNELTVKDVMLTKGKYPVISKKTILKEAMEEMGRTRLGIVCITGEGDKLLGILTDGDIRRKLLKVQKPFSAFFVDDALNHSIQSPFTVRPEQTLKDAVIFMEEKQVWDLPVVNDKGILVGLLHLHPAIQALLGI